MAKKWICRLALTLAGMWLLAPAAAAQDLQTLHKEPVLPRYQTEMEKKQSEEVLGGLYIWECFPTLAGFTERPPKTARFPGEFEQTNGVFYGWPIYGCQMPELTELIRNSIGNVPTTVLVPSAQRFAAEACLRGREFTDEQIALIDWQIIPLDGVWIRDYGQEVLRDADGSQLFVDMGYYSGPSAGCVSFPGRPNDDVSPTRYAPAFGVNVYRPQLRTEGGNLTTDGAGTCFHNQRMVLQQNQFSRWSYTQEQLDDVYRQYYNCPNVVTLESLMRDPFGFQVIDHIDMTTTFISPTKVLHGQYDPADDPVNAAILDQNAELLTSLGYNVVRIPMPKPYCTLRTGSCIAQPGSARECGGGGLDRVWATYANSMRVGSKMLVPVYRDVPESMRKIIEQQEAMALAIYQAELDAEYGKGVVQVVPIIADWMIPCQGTLHCIAMTY